MTPRKPKRYVLVADPPTEAQLAHVAKLEAEGFDVTLLPDPGSRLDLATAYTLAMQERIDATRERLRPNPRPAKTSPTINE